MIQRKIKARGKDSFIQVISFLLSDHKPAGVPPTHSGGTSFFRPGNTELDMDDLNNREYYRARATASHQMAQNARDPQIAKIHETFARHYEAAIESERPRLKVVNE